MWKQLILDGHINHVDFIDLQVNYSTISGDAIDDETGYNLSHELLNDPNMNRELYI